MRNARRVAFIFTSLCLILAVVSMLGSTSVTFATGATSTRVECGSPALPMSLIDFSSPDHAANCAGQTPASLALVLVVLAGVGLGVIAATSVRREPQGSSAQARDHESASS